MVSGPHCLISSGVPLPGHAFPQCVESARVAPSGSMTRWYTSLVSSHQGRPSLSLDAPVSHLARQPMSL